MIAFIFIEDNIHPYRYGPGRLTIMMEKDGDSNLLVSAEEFERTKTTTCSKHGSSYIRYISGVSATILSKVLR